MFQVLWPLSGIQNHKNTLRKSICDSNIQWQNKISFLVVKMYLIHRGMIDGIFLYFSLCASPRDVQTKKVKHWPLFSAVKSVKPNVLENCCYVTTLWLTVARHHPVVDLLFYSYYNYGTYLKPIQSPFWGKYHCHEAGHLHQVVKQQSCPLTHREERIWMSGGLAPKFLISSLERGESWPT